MLVWCSYINESKKDKQNKVDGGGLSKKRRTGKRSKRQEKKVGDNSKNKAKLNVELETQ